MRVTRSRQILKSIKDTYLKYFNLPVADEDLLLVLEEVLRDKTRAFLRAQLETSGLTLGELLEVRSGLSQEECDLEESQLSEEERKKEARRAYARAYYHRKKVERTHRSQRRQAKNILQSPGHGAVSSIPGVQANAMEVHK